ncbi:hypothetical protein WICPIJ_000951 [Wickerhamomyces pijperi]|uniref:Uncharacterized protein n=1 Tax=Wickerhamomyces pijperi TaxID=599730 RepID=A0A9P8QBU1_WICPI|nr:hypothetical protein WICPIJ_000951 [Wickerhamomyces pijperi]
METTNRNEIALQDITQALINLRVLNPMKILDIYEIHDDENSNLKNLTGDLFLRWIVGDIPDNARTVAKVDKSLLNAENVKKPVIKEYLDQNNNMEIGLNTDGTNSGFNGNVSGTGAININDSDENWLQFLMKKKSKFDKSDKFKNTVLTDVVSTVHLNEPGNGLNSNVNAELDEDIPEYLREKLFTTNKENVKLSYEESIDDFDSF